MISSGIRFTWPSSITPVTIAATLLCLLLVCSDAQAGTKVCIEGSTVRSYDASCKGIQGTFKNTSSTKSSVASTKTNDARAPQPTAVPQGHSLTAKSPLGADSNACVEGFNTHLSIGDSFSDYNFLNTKNCNGAQAKGASFSWARDNVALNTQWAAKGAVAEQFIWIYKPDQYPTAPYLNLFAIAPVVNFQRVTNSNTKSASQNVDVLSYGFSSEALIAHIADVWETYIRGRAHINADFEGQTHSWSLTGEIQPFSGTYFVGTNIPVGSIGYLWIQPLVRAQYFQRVNGMADPIFTNGNDVFRAGPVLSINVIPQDTNSTLT